MKETTKNAIKRTLTQAGLRLQKAAFYKYPYDASNYPELANLHAPVIFDVGANIGQSSIWFRHSFPHAGIYAFEPFANVFKQLLRSTNNKNIYTFQIGLSEQTEAIEVPLITDPMCQVGSIKIAAVSKNRPLETIRLSTVDAIAEHENLRTIHILKTDTEGFDINVVKGARRMLESGNVWNVLTEATLDKADSQHSYLYELVDFLQPRGLELYSLYDLNHNYKTGKLQYFNALFKMRQYLG
jgi:FkbM family methyltransferase